MKRKGGPAAPSSSLAAGAGAAPAQGAAWDAGPGCNGGEPQVPCSPGPGASTDDGGARPRVSARQASARTFTRMRDQQRLEDLAFAQHERAEAAKRGRLAGYQQPVLPPAPAAAAAAAATGGPDGAAGSAPKPARRRGGRPPKPRPLLPSRPLLVGERLEAVLAEVRAEASAAFPLGTPVWVKMMGYPAWPGLVWSGAGGALDLCLRCTWPDIVSSYAKGKLLVRFYGENTYSWVAPSKLLPWPSGTQQQAHRDALTQWGKRNGKMRLVGATLAELDGRSDDVQEELGRMERLGRHYALSYLQAAARHRHNSLLRPLTAAATAVAEGSEEGAVAAAAAAAAAAKKGTRVTGNAWGVCDVCREEVPDMRCSSCQRWLHAVCASPAALTPAEYPPEMAWTCPGCGAANTTKQLPEEVLLCQAGGAAEPEAERMGLTPDWLVATAAFKIFQLPRPTPDQPYIAGLLDPASNSKLQPNIPAQLCYTKEDDGLAQSWTEGAPPGGYHIILNPDYRAQVQWRFINKALDTVEGGMVAAVLLICRNSTDTAFFQRLRPYPRVLLRRSSTVFRDYDKCPPGFGVIAVCIATPTRPGCRALYERFYEELSPFGEPNIPVDPEFLVTDQFWSLIQRLRLHADQHARDHWVQCTRCSVWRIISWQQQCSLKSSGAAAEWTCSQLRPGASCAMPQSRRELIGMQTAPPLPAADGPEGGPAGPAAPAAEAAAAETATAAADATPAVEEEEGPAAAAQDAPADTVLPVRRSARRQRQLEQQQRGLKAGEGARRAAAETGEEEQSSAATKQAPGPLTADEVQQLLQQQAADVAAQLEVSFLVKALAGQLTISPAQELVAGRPAEAQPPPPPAAAQASKPAAAAAASPGLAMMLPAVRQLVAGFMTTLVQEQLQACASASEAAAGTPAASPAAATRAGAAVASPQHAQQWARSTAGQADRSRPMSPMTPPAPALRLIGREGRLAAAALAAAAAAAGRGKGKQQQLPQAAPPPSQQQQPLDEKEGGAGAPSEGGAGSRSVAVLLAGSFPRTVAPAAATTGPAQGQAGLPPLQQQMAVLQQLVRERLLAQAPSSGRAAALPQLPGASRQAGLAVGGQMALQQEAAAAGQMAAASTAAAAGPQSVSGDPAGMQTPAAGSAAPEPAARTPSPAAAADGAPQPRGSPALSYRAVWQLAGDPLLRAVLVEQPVLMRAVHALLLEVCRHFRQRRQGGAGSPAMPGAEELGEASAAALDACAGEDVPLAMLQQVCSQMQLLPGSWARSLEAGGSSSAAAAAGGGADGQSAAAAAEEALVGGGAQDEQDDEDSKAEMLSALELARSARLAANKAYLRGLGLGPAALQQGDAQPLAPDDRAVMAAAQQLARQAALARAKQQLARSQRMLDERRRARRSQEARLRAALESLAADEEAAAAQVAAALRICHDVQGEVLS